MSIIDILLDFWWVLLLLIPLYLIYLRVKVGKGFGNFSAGDAKLIGFYGAILLIIYLFQHYIFTDHLYLLFYVIIFLPVFSVFVYLLLMKDNVFIIESTMDAELFYNIGEFETPIAESTRTKAYVIDRDAYRDIKHVGEIDYPYWDGGDGVKFTDFFDQENAVMFHPKLSQLHNVSFYIAKSFWLKMKEDLPDLIRENTMLTWLAPYKATHELSLLAKNFPLRLKNIERQYENTPFALPLEIDELYEREYQKMQADREASEVKIPIAPQQSSESEGGGGDE